MMVGMLYLIGFGCSAKDKARDPQRFTHNALPTTLYPQRFTHPLMKFSRRWNGRAQIG